MLLPAVWFLLGAPAAGSPETDGDAGAKRTGKTDQCVDCHRNLDGELASPVRALQEDVHWQNGLSCAVCHGGAPEEEDAAAAMNPARGFVGRPKAAETPRLCGKCHSDPTFMRRYNPGQRVDQEAEYYTSAHGRRLREGDGRVATCVSCHGRHGIRPVSHPQSHVYPTNVAGTCGTCHADSGYMGSRLPTDQLRGYEASVHARALRQKNDLSAPTCNDCHGNHGASPPGVSSVANVCGACHSRQAGLFRTSVHNQAFRAANLAECLVCHENHRITPPSDRMVEVGEGSTCTACHSSGESGYGAAEAMSQTLRSLVQGVEEAEELVGKAERAGMEVSRARLRLGEAHDALINARVVVHTFSAEAVKKETQKGTAVALDAGRMGQQALDEFQFRRKGLFASLLVIGLALAAIYLKIREVERADKTDLPLPKLHGRSSLSQEIE
jgi:hypothetical protein